MANSTIEVLSPAAVTAGNAVPLAPRVPTLAGRVVGLLDNSKSGTRPFLDRVEELLQSKHGVGRIIRYDKKAAALPVPDEMLEAATRECDVVINGIADWGSCTSWSVHDSIELEKRGVPTATVVTEEFRGLYTIVTTSLGQPGLPAVYVPHPIVSVPHPQMRDRAEPVMTAIVEIATEKGARATAPASGASRPAVVAERITVADDPEAIFERFAREGWTDGLPIVPPTEERVERMLAGCDLDPSVSLGQMPPRWGEATVAKLAVNAVMAGCTPEYFPVVVTAVKAILQKSFNLYGIQGTTNPATPVLIVNGPIAREIGLNARGNLFGPGFRANATIGRAIRLIMTTIGGGVPQQADKSTLGSPAKYTACFAENESDSPWAPLHVEKGFEAGTSTVTAFGGAAPANIIEKSKTAEEMLQTIARALAVSGSNNMFMSQEALLVLGPEHAALAARQGFDKARTRRTLFEHARIPFDQIGRSNADVLSVWRSNCIDEVGGRRTLRIVEKPEDIIIVVAGGAGNHSASIPGWYSRSVTLPIVRADGTALRSVAKGAR